MQKSCKYCQQLFSPKRIDMEYCSASCRQMAYVKRMKGDGFNENASSGFTENVNMRPDVSIDGFLNPEQTSTVFLKGVNNDNKESIDGLTDKEKTSSEGSESVNFSDKASIDGSSKTEKPSINVNGSEKVSTETSTKAVNSEQGDGQKIVQSAFVRELMGLYSDRSDWQTALISMIFNGSESAYWVSVRLRCIIERLLTFSDRKYIDGYSLVKVHNALVVVCKSSSFKSLPQNYPYVEAVLELVDSLNFICLQVKGNARVRFILKRDTKVKLIVFRSELAQVVPNRGFKVLGFE